MPAGVDGGGTLRQLELESLDAPVEEFSVDHLLLAFVCSHILLRILFALPGREGLGGAATRLRVGAGPHETPGQEPLSHARLPEHHRSGSLATGGRAIGRPPGSGGVHAGRHAHRGDQLVSCLINCDAELLRRGTRKLGSEQAWCRGPGLGMRS
jgi:hypothetical protein